MFNAWGEKISFFLKFVIFWCNRQNVGPKSEGGGCLTRGEKKSYFFSDSLFFGVNDKILVLIQGGGVYHVIIGISDFGPKRGGVFISGGVFGMKGTVFINPYEFCHIAYFAIA